MYRDVKICIHPKHALYPYFDTVAHKANNLYNAALYRMRQILTGIVKDPKVRTTNEREILREMGRTIDARKGKSHPSKKEPYVDYAFLYHMLYINRNPDYLCKELPSQTGQQMLKNAIRDMKGFYKSSKDYAKHPHKYLGRPKMPNYKTSGGLCTFVFTNQQVQMKQAYYSFPCTKLRLPGFAYVDASWELKEVKVVPMHKAFMLHFIFDDTKPIKSLKDISERICAIDLGVSNFAAMTNNVGLPSVLFKGGRIKSVNHWYNKRIRDIQHKQTVGTTKKFQPTEAYHRITQKRNFVMEDAMHKIAKYIVTYCVTHAIDTLVVGENKGWKQKANMGETDNQNFVQIPYSKFKNNLAYLCEREGIRFIRQEESYTSKASHKDGDAMQKTTVFSGVRGPSNYMGHVKATGFRGLYKCQDGTILNADLNASANIGRKAIPFYTCLPQTFQHIQVIRRLDAM